MKHQFFLRWVIFTYSLKHIVASGNDDRDNPIRKLEPDRVAETSNRKLWGLCEDGSQPIIHYFEVLIRIQPSSDASGSCSLADQMKLGSDINSILTTYVSHFNHH
jgi:hypothetical protein